MHVRVLSVQHYPAFGGPYNEILQLEPHLNAAGVRTIVAMTNDAGTAFPRLQGKVDVWRMPLRRAHLTKDLWVHWRTARSVAPDIRRLKRLIERESIDLIKVHGMHNPHGAIAAHLAVRPVVWVISSTRTPASWRRIGTSLVDKLASAVLVQGHGPNLLKSYPGGDRLYGRMVGYFSPVDVRRFQPLSSTERQRVRAELGLPEQAPVVGMVANLNPMKGVETFVDAAHQIAAQSPAVRFAVAGATDANHRAYADQVMATASELGLYPERLTFLGERRDVERVMGAFDVKVVTSVPGSEGTTTTAPEAMACGVPVVATEVGAIRDVLDDGVTGKVVAAQDSRAVADGVLQLLDNPELRAKMSDAGRTTALARFTPEQSAEAHLRAYEFAVRSGQ